MNKSLWPTIVILTAILMVLFLGYVTFSHYAPAPAPASTEAPAAAPAKPAPPQPQGS